jgi:hypothetical protein
MEYKGRRMRNGEALQTSIKGVKDMRVPADVRSSAQGVLAKVLEGEFSAGR